MCAYNTAVAASTAQTAQFQQALTGKADTDLANVASHIDYVVDYYQDSCGWYRVYKSGWVEQGGGNLAFVSTTNIETVNFFKPMQAVQTVVAGVTSTGTAFPNSGVVIYGLSTTGFLKQHTMNASGGWSWYACGQMAEE